MQPTTVEPLGYPSACRVDDTGERGRDPAQRTLARDPSLDVQSSSGHGDTLPELATTLIHRPGDLGVLLLGPGAQLVAAGVGEMEPSATRELVRPVHHLAAGLLDGLH